MQDDQDRPDPAAVMSASCAWAVFLFPVALGALIFIVPHILDALGWFFHIMRSLAEAAK